MKKLLIIFVGLVVVVFSCTKDSVTETNLDPPTNPFNPFDTIDYDETMVPKIPVDSNSFLGIHYYILANSCNQPGCHDGSFEPDYRTVQSSYSTLVFHDVIKNFPSNPVPYRVTPGDPSQSMLYRRITEHNPPNFERMPSSGNQLPDNLIQLIKNWIDDGARDIYGNLPSQTSSQPTSYGLAAFLPNSNNMRVDTIRGNFIFNPFLAPEGEELELWFLYLDVTENNDTIFGDGLTYNKMKLSTNPFDFSNAVELDLSVPLIPNMIASAYSQPLGFPVPYYQNVTFKPADYGFNVGDVVYIRTYVQDSDHSNPTEIPQGESQVNILTYFAFSIQ